MQTSFTADRHPSPGPVSAVAKTELSPELDSLSDPQQLRLMIRHATPMWAPVTCASARRTVARSGLEEVLDELLGDGLAEMGFELSE
jgi:hypothetical protein